MTSKRLRSSALWGGSLLSGLLLAGPPVEAATRPDSQGLEQGIDPIKKAISEVERNARITPPLQHALNKLLRTLEEEEREHRHPRHHHEGGSFGAGFEQAATPSTGHSGSAPGGAEANGNEEARLEQALKQLLQTLEEEEQHHRHHRRQHQQEEGSFGAGFEQAGEGSQASTGSADSSDPSGDSSGGNPGSGGSGQSGSPMVGGKGTSSTSNPSSNQAQKPQPHRGGRNPFAWGLRHAEREWRIRREERRLRHLEHAFARGLIAHHLAEEHADNRPGHSDKNASGNKATDPTPRTGPTQTAGPSLRTPERHEHEWTPEPQHPRPFEQARKGVVNHPAGAQARTEPHPGQHPAPGRAAIHPPSGAAGHASPAQHAGALVGRRHPEHRK
jgi:hypothetical protein